MNRAVQIGSLILLSGSYAAAIAQTVYKTTDGEGHVAYTDRPSLYLSAGDVVEAVPGLNINGTNTNQVTAMNSEPTNRSQVLTGNEEPSAANNADMALKQEHLYVRTTNCKTSQLRLTQYSRTSKIFKTNPDGSRDYLSAEEIDAVRSEAQADVNEWCD